MQLNLLSSSSEQPRLQPSQAAPQTSSWTGAGLFHWLTEIRCCWSCCCCLVSQLDGTHSPRHLAPQKQYAALIKPTKIVWQDSLIPSTLWAIARRSHNVDFDKEIHAVQHCLSSTEAGYIRASVVEISSAATFALQRGLPGFLVSEIDQQAHSVIMMDNYGQLFPVTKPLNPQRCAETIINAYRILAADGWTTTQYPIDASGQRLNDYVGLKRIAMFSDDAYFGATAALAALMTVYDTDMNGLTKHVSRTDLDMLLKESRHPDYS